MSRERAQFAARREDNMVDLGEVVVFSGQPEDGGVRRARRGCLARAGQGRGGFEGRKQRSAEQAHLLAGYDHSRPAAQGFKGRSGSR
jgi:hypothetical protein